MTTMFRLLKVNVKVKVVDSDATQVRGSLW